MKFYKILVSFFLATGLLFSCSSDSDDANNPQHNLPGNSLQTGDSANNLLANGTFSKLLVEIVYPDGFSPAPIALDNLKNFLEARTFKQNIIFEIREIPAPAGAPYSISEIVDIEENNRTHYNEGNKIAVFVFFANGNNQEDTNDRFVLGSAYRNTSIVIYEKTIQQQTGSPLGPSKQAVETVALQHEFGHLFGLVNIGSPPQSEHEDPNSEAHCTTEDCLMNANAEFAGTLMEMMGSGLPELEAECLADLQANGGR